MTRSLVLAVSLSLLPAARAQLHSAWKYQRSIEPSANLPEAPQCVVLDAGVFSHAAPGLRDLRLVQDGREIPYALDESHDEAFDRAASAKSKNRLPVNRAQYETSLLIPAHATYRAGVAGQSTSEYLPGWFYGEGELPAHVPVERIRIVPEPIAPEVLELDAWQSDHYAGRESLQATLQPLTAAVNFTIGANLQAAVEVHVAVHGTVPVIERFVLEMRRRELCFQPLSHAPLFLLLGNESARPVRYEYAARFQPEALPLLATLGPLQANPAFKAPRPLRPTVLTVDRILEVLFAGCAFIVSVICLRAPRMR